MVVVLPPPPLSPCRRFQEEYKFYGVFDGHCGTRAAKFASRALHLNLELFLSAQAPDDVYSPSSTATATPGSVDGSKDRRPGRGGGEDAGGGGGGVGDRGDVKSARHDRHASVERAVRAAFRKTQLDFLELLRHRVDGAGAGPGAAEGLGGGREKVMPPSGATGGGGAGAAAGAAAEDDSGTTATVALVYPDVTVVAHVGDSRAVMCCDESGNAVEITEGKSQ